jgi:hypothetical protein
MQELLLSLCGEDVRLGLTILDELHVLAATYGVKALRVRGSIAPPHELRGTIRLWLLGQQSESMMRC